MKKLVLVLLIVFITAGYLFAQNYTVESVTGRVQRETISGRVNVAAGEVLSSNTVINTGLGASLVLKSGDNTFTISAARNGTISELLSSASGVRVGANVVRVDTEAAVRTGGQASTASARASDAAEDDDISAE